LVIHPINDDPGHYWIPLPDKSGGKVYAYPTGRKLLELSETDKKNNSDDLLSFAMPTRAWPEMRDNAKESRRSRRRG
jgi:hypothetical protein